MPSGGQGKARYHLRAAVRAFWPSAASLSSSATSASSDWRSRSPRRALVEAGLRLEGGGGGGGSSRSRAGLLAREDAVEAAEAAGAAGLFGRAEAAPTDGRREDAADADADADADAAPAA